MSKGRFAMKPGKDYIGVGLGLLIMNDDGEFLFTKRGPKAKNEQLHWEIPGGTVEYGETLAATAHREAQEELGVEIEIIDQFGTIDHFIPKQSQHWVAVEYLCKIKDGQTPKIMEPHKCIELRWCSLEDLPSPLSTSSAPTIAAYQRYVSRKSH